MTRNGYRHDKRRRRVTIMIRLLVKEKMQLCHAAKRHGQGVSTWMRDEMLKAAAKEDESEVAA